MLVVFMLAQRFFCLCLGMIKEQSLVFVSQSKVTFSDGDFL